MNIDKFIFNNYQILPMSPEFISIDTDENGIIPSVIETVFEERIKKGLKLPKVFIIQF